MQIICKKHANKVNKTASEKRLLKYIGTMQSGCSYVKINHIRKHSNPEIKNLSNNTVSHEKTFEDVCNIWMAECVIKNKQTTCSRYSYVTKKYLLPRLKDIRISKIQKVHINEMVKELYNENKLSAKTVQDIISVFSQIMKLAENHGYINENNLSIAKPPLQKSQLKVLTNKEQKTLVDFLKSNMSLENMGILLSLFTGMRLGEICALKWEDIDLENKVIYVCKTMQRISVTEDNAKKQTKIIIDVPKTQNSIRKIPIPDFLTEDLCHMAQSTSNECYFLTGDCKKFTEPRKYQYRFKKTLKQAGVQEINFHALRHTFATRAVEQNFDGKSLSEILGHSTVGFTLERYVHPSFELKKQNMERLKVCY